MSQGSISSRSVGFSQIELRCDLCRASVDVNELAAKLAQILLPDSTEYLHSSEECKSGEDEPDAHHRHVVKELDGRDIFVGSNVEAESSWPGNKLFRKVLDKYYHAYATAKCKHQKNILAQKVFDRLNKEDR